LEHAPFLGGHVQLRLVAMKGAAAGVLGAIERKIGGADQHLGRAPVARPHRQADRGTDEQRVLVDLIGAGDRVDDRLGQPLDARGVGCVANHHGELVAAEAPDHLVVAHQLLQPLGDAHQQSVAHRMAQRVV
ncbi:hypothetical protein QU39_00065, partial [Staphylococcus aureus]